MAANAKWRRGGGFRNLQTFSQIVGFYAFPKENTDEKSTFDKLIYNWLIIAEDRNIDSPCRDQKTSSPGRDLNSASPCRDQNTSSPRRDLNSASPCIDQNTSSPGKDLNSASPWRDLNTGSPGRNLNNPSPCRDRNSASPWSDRKFQSSRNVDRKRVSLKIGQIKRRGFLYEIYKTLYSYTPPDPLFPFNISREGVQGFLDFVENPDLPQSQKLLFNHITNKQVLDI